MNRLDHRIGNVIIDANALDPVGGDRTNIDRFLSLKENGTINVIAPWGVRQEGSNPNTPADVRQDIGAQIYSIQAELCSDEQVMLAKIRSILQGNAKPGQHDADAEHIFEAQKYGGRYFVTHDIRMNSTKRQELEALLSPFAIVTLDEFLTIYDNFAANSTSP